MNRRSFLIASTVAAYAQTDNPATQWEYAAGGGRIVATIGSDLNTELIQQWIRRAAQAVIAYYGAFPVNAVQLRVQPAAGKKGVFGGTTFGSTPARIRVSVGVDTTQEQFDNDWVLTHEMVHLAFPSLPRPQHWLEEGLATYVEPIARVQTGQLSSARFWTEFARDLPQGLPADGDQGLDHTHTWGRTYWGGALFCFWAELQIREQTQNRHGLQSALRGVVKLGGTVNKEWPLADALQIADKATGVSVLTNLYAQWKAAPVAPDLNQVWQKLGIVLRNGAVTFADAAPLAETRKAILRRIHDR